MPILKVMLPSGNLAAFDVDHPGHVTDPERIRMHHRHLATQFGGVWHSVTGQQVVLITDAKTLAMLDAAPLVEAAATA